MNVKKCGIFLIFILSILFTNECLSEVHEFKVGYQDNDGFPNVMGQGTKVGNPPGVGVDIIFKVAKNLNIKLLVSRLPNKRVHKYLSLGSLDGSGFYSFKKDRLKEGVFPTKNGKLDKSKRVSVLGYYMYILKGSKVSWDGEILTGVKYVGANSGYSVVGNLKKLGLTVNEVKSTKQNLEMLLKGRIQAYAAQDGTIDPVIASYKRYANLIKIGPPIKTKEYYFMFSHKYYKNNREMAHKIWDQIEVVRDSVLAKYRKMNFRPVIK
ncbi:MAG: transporter substrate-binding domain-containing protein [Deltaproteobacteria bacterium]|nr:transporter substrate-binding domain-containing protein [Deltaproteobacteria bacterium]